MAVKGNNAVDRVVSGLSKLEYRGYDSCGLAYMNNKDISIIKSIGYVSTLKDKVYGIENIPSQTIAIGHTRWATHGGVTENNCHPHMSLGGRVCVVHNGIIENYLDIKNSYLSDRCLISETDTETIPNLIDKYISDGLSPIEAINMATKDMLGSYAIAIIIRDDDRLYFAKRSSPLIVAKANDDYILASDILGIDCDSGLIYLEDDVCGYIDNTIHIFDINMQEIDNKYIDKKISEIQPSEENEDYMYREIYQMPRAIERTYRSMLGSTYRLPSRIDRVLVVACGTSYHSGLMGKKFIERYSGIKVECEIASEFIYNDYIIEDNTLGIFISQSGETADTLRSMRKARRMGIYTLAITNVEHSTIHRECDECVLMSAGPEVAVASTKAYSTQLFVLLMLSNIIKNIRSGSCDVDGDFAIVDINRLSNYLPVFESEYSQVFDIDISRFEEEVLVVAQLIKDRDGIHFIGKDCDYITSMEGSLKLKEISYKFTDAYPSGELKHGTLSLVDENSYSVAIVTEERLIEKCKNSIHEITARGGRVIVVTPFVEEFSNKEVVIRLPKINSVFMPIVAIMAIDLLAYRVTKLLGINPDKPRNLAKSVTVE